MFLTRQTCIKKVPNLCIIVNCSFDFYLLLISYLNEASKPREVGGDGGHAHDGALGRGVAPGLVVAGEHAEVAATHKLLVAQTEQRVVRVQKVGMEYNLDPVLGAVQETASLQSLQDRILFIRNYVVSCDRRPEKRKV